MCPAQQILLIISALTFLPVLRLECRNRAMTHRHRLAARDLIGTIAIYCIFFTAWGYVLASLCLIAREHAVRGYLGLLIFAIGAALRLLALSRLGASYAGDVVVLEDRPLVKTGIYSVIRHPLHLGLLVELLGLCLMIPSVITAIPFLLAVAWALRRNRIEDRALAVFYGTTATVYQAEVPALNPVPRLLRLLGRAFRAQALRGDHDG